MANQGARSRRFSAAAAVPSVAVACCGLALPGRLARAAPGWPACASPACAAEGRCAPSAARSPVDEEAWRLLASPRVVSDELRAVWARVTASEACGPAICCAVASGESGMSPVPSPCSDSGVSLLGAPSLTVEEMFPEVFLLDAVGFPALSAEVDAAVSVFWGPAGGGSGELVLV